jgi:membrane protein DedA with SNARE-associated domain
MNPWVAIMAGTVGSLAGAYANYFGAHYLGRPLVLKYGKYVLIPPEKFQRVERFFLRHGEISTFIGRLLPVVRHLISIPAGLSGMNHLRFSTYTLLGAFTWCSILTWIGYVIGRNQELIMVYSRQAVIWAAVGSCLLVVAYVWLQRRKTGGLSAGAAATPTGE